MCPQSYGLAEQIVQTARIIITMFTKLKKKTNITNFMQIGRAYKPIYIKIHFYDWSGVYLMYNNCFVTYLLLSFLIEKYSFLIFFFFFLEIVLQKKIVFAILSNCFLFSKCNFIIFYLVFFFALYNVNFFIWKCM